MVNKRALAVSILVLLGTVSSSHAKGAFKAVPILKESTTIAGQPIKYLQTDTPEVTSVLVEIQPGGESGVHKHPVPPQIYVLEGNVTIEFDNGDRKSFSAGEAFIEAVDMWHNAKNLGETPVKMLVVFFGEQGKKNLVRP